MAIPKPITRVEQYLAHISGMRVNVPEAPITREERYLAAWAKKSGIEDAEIQGDPPLTLKDCIGEPFKGLTLYGKSTQVTTTGAQLFEPISNKLNLNGITIIFDENGEKIVVSGTAELSQGIQIGKPIKMQASEKYTLAFDENHYFENVWLQSSSGVKFGWSGKNTSNKVVITVPDSIAEKTDCAMYASVKKGEAYNFPINHLMLNAGDTALPWEPYTGGKPSPSPDYPQEIQSAKSEVVVKGKNLFGGRFYYARYSSGIMYINKAQKDEEVKFPYQPESETAGICKALKCQKGKTYVISVTNPNKNAVLCMAEYENIENAFSTINALGFVNIKNATKSSYTAKSDGILVCGIAGTWTDGKTTLHECTESELLQVEEASEATDYEPYRPPQTLTLTSPTSLPGIPADSGGNYTDPTGQQWICDQVDLERGVYVQRIAEAKIKSETVHAPMDPKWYDSEKSYSYEAEYAVAMANTGDGKGFCSHLSSYVFMEFYNKGIETGWLGTSCYGVFNFSKSLGICKTVDEFLMWIQDVKIYKILESPIETPLSETDIAAYRALTTYGPTTILESECGLKVKYSKLRRR